MEITINTLAERIASGIKRGLAEDEIREAAERFMQDNGYKLTDAGKQVAIAELEDLDEYPSELIAAVGTAIATL